VSEEQYLTLKQVVDDQMWGIHQKEMRRHFHVALGEKLVEWIVDHGPAIVSGIEEMAVVSSTLLGMTEIRYRMTLIPIGPLLEHEFYFQDGPVDGQRLKTDGSPYWRTPITGEPMRMSDYWADGPTAAATKGPLVAVYIRKDGYYRFEGYER
jgi:hypothetical protein